MHMIPAGVSAHKINAIVNGRKPKRVFVALIRHAAASGSYTLNPFRYQPFDVRSIACLIDGAPLNGRKVECNFDEFRVATAYMAFLRTAGHLFDSSSASITYNDFYSKRTVFGFDLTGDFCEGARTHLISNCTTSFEFTFSTALPSTVSVFIYTEVDDMIEIDVNNKVILS